MKLLLFTIFVFYSTALLANKVDVTYAGFAVSAEYKDIDKSAYFTNKIIEKKGNIIDKSLIDITKKLLLDNIKINYGLIDNKNSKIAMSVFLDQEILEEFKLSETDCKKINISDCYIYRINNYYQIIFFDFEKMTFLHAIPFDGLYVSDPTKKLDEKGKIKIFEEFYDNGKWLKPPDFDQTEYRAYTDILPQLKLKYFYDNYLGVNPSVDGFKINISKVENLLPDNISNNIYLLKRQIANFFLGEIALKHKVPIVPYYEGVGIGQKLKAKYADRSEVFELTLPEPTHFIDFNIRGFVKKKFKEDSNIKNLTWWVYGAGIDLRFYQPELQKEYLNISMTKANFKKIPDVMKLTKKNEFVNLYQLTYGPLAVEFSNILKSDFKNKKDRDWLKKITKGQTTVEQLENIQSLLNKLKIE